MMHCGLLVYLCFLSIAAVFANTEVVNFEVSEARNFDIWFVREWPTLTYSRSVLDWNLTANSLDTSSTELNQAPCVRLYHWTPITTPENCLQELWLALDLDGEPWSTYNKFTLRISWPASYPVDVYLKIFDSSDIAPLPRPGPPRRFRNRRITKYNVRRKLARVQLVNTGVLNPKSELAKMQDPTMLPGPVPLILRLEPLVFGFIPESVVPTIYAIVGALVVGTFVARAVIARLQGEVEEYSKSLVPKEKKKEE